MFTPPPIEMFLRGTSNIFDVREHIVAVKDKKNGRLIVFLLLKKTI